MVEGLGEYGRADHGQTLVHGAFVVVICVEAALPLSSSAARGGVTVLLKLMEEAFMCGLLMGTLWCENSGFGSLHPP
jgi:hypothetical protein